MICAVHQSVSRSNKMEIVHHLPLILGSLPRTRKHAVPSFRLSSLDFVLWCWPVAAIPHKRKPFLPLAFLPDSTCQPRLFVSVVSS